MTMPLVRDCMDRDTNGVLEDDDLYRVVQMMIDRGITGAPVIDGGGRVLGMITEAECLGLLSHGADGAVPQGTVAEFMLRDVVTVKPEMDIYYVAGLFNAHPTCRRFAVVGPDERLVAVVTRKDILKVVHRELMRSTSVPPPP